jgi:tRNA-splicing ligase RtcB
MYNKKEQKFPVKIWVNDKNDIELGAIEQIKNMSNLPFIHKHISIMPDTHQGYGVVIGGVLATENVVIPNAVGSDIGCGMCFIKSDLNYNKVSNDTYKKIVEIIKRKIPVGFAHHKESQSEENMPDGSKIINHFSGQLNNSIILEEYTKALYQLGTLGGGNHFIELQKDENDNLCIMLHSGSRNLGYKVAKHYNNLAIDLNEKWYSSVPKEYELAFLPLNSKEGQNYLLEMQYCLEFALANRKLMMYRIMDIVKNCIKKYDKKHIGFDSNILNIAHNYVDMENHFKKNVLVHRKGATRVRKDEMGIIPGSQGSCSYIVKGLGNKDSFMSCSHGAGRIMSRTKAKEKLNLQDEINKMNKQGIIHSINNEKDLDEADGAYKNIDEVMENQKDLVKIIHKLKPIAVIKG